MNAGGFHYSIPSMTHFAVFSGGGSSRGGSSVGRSGGGPSYFEKSLCTLFRGRNRVSCTSYVILNHSFSIFYFSKITKVKK